MMFKPCMAAIAAAVALFAAKPEAQSPAPRFRMIVIGELTVESGGNEIHRPFVEAATGWLNQLAKDSNFTVAYLNSPNTLTDAMLANIDLVWQANFTPYRWNATAKAAFEKYLNAGKGGWVGNHHASLYGSVVTQETWPFFAKLIGEISYKNYVSKFASGDVRVEDAVHPVMKGVPATFNVSTEEWYTWDKNPRPKVKVLANLDEASMKFVSQSESGIKMGDHPVVWTYEGYKARNIYIFMGHHPNLFQNTAYVTMLRNALFWAANIQSSTTTTAAAPGSRREDRITDHGRDGKFIFLPGNDLHDEGVVDAAGHRLRRSGAGAGRYLALPR
jgi:type 1 glutamine amidotransferase